MAYKKIYLDQLQDLQNKIEMDKIVQDLANKVFKNENISLAEEEFVCSILS